MPRRLDPLAVGAAALALLVLVGYLVLVNRPEQSGDPAWWFVVVLVLGAAGASYGAVTSAPRRTWVLLGTSILMMGSGFLAILSVGLPVLLGGALCQIAAVRSTRTAVPQQS